MDRAVSSSSLRVAGVEMSHVPKRATQHGVFLASSERPPTSLKPGQKSLQRQVYTEEAKQLGETYIAQDMPAASVYAKSLAGLAKPEDYCNPTKPIRPADAPEGGGGHHGTAHWRSEYRSSMDHRALHGSRYHRQHGPSYQAMNPPTCVSAGALSTSYHEEFGKRGSDPREKIHPHSDRLPVFKTELTKGTTKATNHIPGYQGFLATNTVNPHVSRAEMGGTTRSVDKTNLTEIFHTNLVNYHGHVPAHHSNDNGGVQTSLETTMGRDYQHPAVRGLC